MQPCPDFTWVLPTWVLVVAQALSPTEPSLQTYNLLLPHQYGLGFPPFCMYEPHVLTQQNTSSQGLKSVNHLHKNSFGSSPVPSVTRGASQKSFTTGLPVRSFLSVDALAPLSESPPIVCLHNGFLVCQCSPLTRCAPCNELRKAFYVACDRLHQPAAGTLDAFGGSEKSLWLQGTDCCSLHETQLLCQISFAPCI